MRMRHGHCGSPEYKVWKQVKRRCFDPKSAAFKDYGAKGITMYPGWVHDFPAFLAEMGPRPTLQHSIDRIDGSKGYEPGNVRWATKVEQSRNRPSIVVPLTLNGQTMLMTVWAEILGVRVQTLAGRRRRGWPVERILQAEKVIGGKTRSLTLHSKTQSISAWARQTRIKEQTIRMRLKRGWSVEAALTG